MVPLLKTVTLTEVMKMPKQARGEVIDPNEVHILHCIAECVSKSWLCGTDPATGECFEHRRGWIRDRIEFLASGFAIDCLTFSIMSNHLYLVLRSRPDVVAAWSDEEVAQRWLRLFPACRNSDGSPAVPTTAELNTILNQPEVLASRRQRFSDVSWHRRCLAENIVRRSNAEDSVTGHFWEGRFRAQVLLYEASLLACAAYVDLNPIRAAMAETPESSKYTGAKDRIGLNTHAWCDVVSRFGRVFERAAGSPEHLAEEAGRRGQGWLCARNNPLGISSA
ncbi:hypothetical protein [Allorhodopirellula solitaria]|uniref:Transposase IS200-like domain-containing protein n=1 Tax=Allorhodopirellula solitaria TaxID=2527987 RepID=A0A5C5XUT0_9BACT|nr:hypothetical protein [Allorhodopirellula solitaria]TWT66664.1 hypothetical protein CA85_27610 [Allorhodopirellula solitaria]